MSDHLTFMMGRFQARFPTDRRYARNHMWARQHDGAFRFGFAAYAARLLQNIYFLEWDVEIGDKVEPRQDLGFIESSKAQSDICCPMGGVVTDLNLAVLYDPSIINSDMYGAGWLFAIRGSGDDLLTPEEYLRHVAAVWEITQQAIKGQTDE